MKKELAPVVFWYSEPLRPDETLVVSGENFSRDAFLEILGPDGKWNSLEPLQRSAQSLKAVIPSDYPYAAWKCRIRGKNGMSEIFTVNAPDVRWMMDDAVGQTHPGGRLRIFGTCLNLAETSKVKLGEKELPCSFADCFEAVVDIPPDFPQGEFAFHFFNGSTWKASGEIKVVMQPSDIRPVIDLAENPNLDPTGKKDCTLCFVIAIERARNLGGAIIRIPRGRFRIDSILRPGTYVDSPLLIPENVTLRGEGMNETSLWWPDKNPPLPVLMEGSSCFSIESLAIYAQGPLHDIIRGNSNVKIENVLIRARSDYMTVPGVAHHGRPVPPESQRGGNVIDLWGNNNRVFNCDISHDSGSAIRVCKGGGTIIGNNMIRGCGISLAGAQKVVLENNSIRNGSGIGISTFWSNRSENLFICHNKISELYFGDREAITLDGHGSAYFGHIENVQGCSFDLVDKIFQRTENRRGILSDLFDCAVYVVDGYGAGQIRNLHSCDGRHVSIDRPWDAPPDKSSLIAISTYNGKHLILNNYCEDSGTVVQLYPPNAECIVAGNKGLRCGNFNSLGAIGTWPDINTRLDRITQLEMSYYNQFFDNELLNENGWGGSESRPDYWIGGRTGFNIYGGCWRRIYDEASGRLIPRMHNAEWLKLVLKDEQEREYGIPASRFQIIRRQKNNGGEIIVQGAVDEVVIEHCFLRNPQTEIQIRPEKAHHLEKCQSILYDWSSPDIPEVPFLSPRNLLLRENKIYPSPETKL